MDLFFYAFTTIVFCFNHASAIIKCTSANECVLLNSCPSLKAFFNPLTKENIAHLRGLTCGFDGLNPKVCCDTSGTIPPTTSQITPPSTSLLPSCSGSIGERVIGGRELPVRSYQWMALIGYGTSPDWGCAGSLISERYVLTAAHCADTRFTYNRPISRVRLGEHDISKDEDCQIFVRGGKQCAPAVQDFVPHQIIIHDDWNQRGHLLHDIALIRLDRTAQLHRYVQPICLPPYDLGIFDFLNGREAQVAGWGRTENVAFSHVRRMVEVPFVDKETCRQKFSNSKVSATLLDKGQVCFGGVVDKDSCAGDSGGPLVSTDLNADSASLSVLLGVVSYGSRACGTELPAVYTEVSQYRYWILSNLRP